MATIEFIEKRIAGKEKEISRLQKKIERILKAKSTNWEVNPYYYNENDLTYAEKDLSRTQEELASYQKELVAANEKANSRNVPAITEFLNMWENKTIEYFLNQYNLYEEALKEYYEINRKYNDWYYDRYKLRGTVSEEEFKTICKTKDKENSSYRKEFKARWSHVTQFNHGNLPWEETMKKDIAKEKDRKYDFIIERTNDIVGQITDASNLYVGAKQDLNGYIIGTKGKASVNTIGAGGYNIQCFHFRTLINPIA